MPLSTRPIAVIGSINADLVAGYDQALRMGNYVLGGEFHFSSGGKSLNNAVSLTSLGSRVDFLARVGDDIFGRTIIEDLDRLGIATKSISVDDSHHTGIGHVRVNSDGEYDTVVVLGANNFLKKSDIDNLISQENQYSYLILNLEMPLDILKYAANRFREIGAKVVLNFSPISIAEFWMLEYADLAIMNLSEAQSILKTNQSTGDEMLAAIVGSGAKSVVITMGGLGSIAQDENGQRFHEPTTEVAVVNAIGAGDAFLAMFVHSINVGFPFADALKNANEAGKLICQKTDSFLTSSDLKTIEVNLGYSLHQSRTEKAHG